jgi:hypothetical protein
LFLFFLPSRPALWFIGALSPGKEIQAMSDRKLNDRCCPICGYSLDIDTKIIGPEEQSDPKAGDITMCWNCTSVLIFNKAINLVIPNQKELADITADPRYQLLLNTVTASKRRKINLN